ncbi:MAG: ABC transporter ATP-binding protein [Patescibacteria group bacterium]
MDKDLEQILENLPDEEKIGLWQVLKSLPWAWRRAYQTDRTAACVMTVLPMVEIPRSMAVVLIPGMIVSAAQKFIVGDQTVQDRIIQLLAVFVAFQFLQLLSRYLNRKYAQRLSLVYGYAMRRQVMEQHAALPYQILERKEFREFMDKLDRKTYVPQQLVWQSNRMLFNLAAIIGSISAFYYMPVWTWVCVCISVLINVVGGSWTAKKHRKRMKAETHEGKRNRYYESTLRNPEALLPVVLNQGVPEFLSQWDKNAGIIKDKNNEENLAGLKTGALASLLEMVGYTGGFIYILRKILAGGADLGLFVMFSSSYGRLSGSLQDLVEQLFWLQMEGPYIPLLEKFFDLPREKQSGHAVPAEQLVMEFHDVWFRYPGTDKWILQGASFKIREGEHLALVGENAEGKSTILKLIAGLYRPTSGSITVNGIDLADIKPVEWRTAISYLRQNMPDYYDRVEELIRYGNPNAPKDPVRFGMALEVSTLSKMLNKFGAALDKVWVGKQYAMVDSKDEVAIDLSGGMKNAVDLARAVYKFARLYIFDEPTSNLDPQRNKEFFREFRSQFKGRTTIYVSHRFSTNCHANRIVLLKDGKVVEEGSHDELMEHGRFYPALFLAEAGDYLEAVKQVSRARYIELTGRPIGQA